MVQTIYCYYFTAHSTTWEPDTVVYPFEDRPQHIMDIRPLEPVSWSSVPLALRITFPDATSHALRLTLRRRRLPHDEDQQLAPNGESCLFQSHGQPISPLQLVLRYTSAHTCRPIAWLLPVKAGLCLCFRRNTQRVLRLILPTSGTAPLEQDGFTVELLPKLVFSPFETGLPPQALLVLAHVMMLQAGCPLVGPPSLNQHSPIGGGAGPTALAR